MPAEHTHKAPDGRTLGGDQRPASRLVAEFFGRSFWITAILALILFVTVPTVMYLVEIERYKDDSVALIHSFIERELGPTPWLTLEDPEEYAALSLRISTFMEIAELVDFKIWRADGTVFYSYRTPEAVGVKFPKNESLEEAIASGEPEVEIDEPETESESRMLAGFGKLFEIYVPIVRGGKVLGAVEIYRTAPRYQFLGPHVYFTALVAMSLFVLLYVLLFGSFRRAAARIIEYDEKLARANTRIRESYADTITSLLKALELRDMETEGHSERVVALSMLLSDKLGLLREDRARLLLGSFLHDIGKIGVPDAILLKKGLLTPEEREQMKTHVAKGRDLIEGVPILAPAVDVVLFHHEKWDGSGYLHGLSGEAIPLTARVFALVDVYDALMNKRPYKEPLSREETLSIIRADSGTHFDPRVASAMLETQAWEIEAAIAPSNIRAVREELLGALRAANGNSTA